MKFMPLSSRYINWRFGTLKKRVEREYYSRFYRDNYPAIERSIMIAGTARSGTTWLADIVASQLRSRIMFEPFHAGKVAAYGNFHYFQYLRPHERNEAFYAFCQTVFDGSIRDPWVDRQVEHLRPEYRIIKEVRANLFLGWLKRNFPTVPLIMLMRHPCAVVLSHMELNWIPERDIASMLAQEKLVEDHLIDNMDVIENAQTPEEKHAVIWSIHTLVSARQLSEHRWNVIFYENLCTQPEVEIPRIFRILGHHYDSSIYQLVDRPSTTAQSHSAVVNSASRIARWQQQLSAEQIARIQRIVADFGLDYIYGADLVPKVDTL